MLNHLGLKGAHEAFTPILMKTRTALGVNECRDTTDTENSVKFTKLKWTSEACKTSGERHKKTGRKSDLPQTHKAAYVVKATSALAAFCFVLKRGGALADDGMAPFKLMDAS